MVNRSGNYLVKKRNSLLIFIFRVLHFYHYQTDIIQMYHCDYSIATKSIMFLMVSCTRNTHRFSTRIQEQFANFYEAVRFGVQTFQMSEDVEAEIENQYDSCFRS